MAPVARLELAAGQRAAIISPACSQPGRQDQTVWTDRAATGVADPRRSRDSASARRNGSRCPHCQRGGPIDLAIEKAGELAAPSW